MCICVNWDQLPFCCVFLVLFDLVQAYCIGPIDLYLLSCDFCKCALYSLFVVVVIIIQCLSVLSVCEREW